MNAKAAYKFTGVFLWTLATVIALQFLCFPGHGDPAHRVTLTLTVPLLSGMTLHSFLWGRQAGHIVRFCFIVIFLLFSSLVYLRHVGRVPEDSTDWYAACMMALPLAAWSCRARCATSGDLKSPTRPRTTSTSTSAGERSDRRPAVDSGACSAWRLRYARTGETRRRPSRLLHRHGRCAVVARHRRHRLRTEPANVSPAPPEHEPI